MICNGHRELISMDVWVAKKREHNICLAHSQSVRRQQTAQGFEHQENDKFLFGLFGLFGAFSLIEKRKDRKVEKLVRAHRTF